MANDKEYSIGRIVTYALQKVTDHGPLCVNIGSLAIDSVYKGPDRSARSLLAYINAAALEDATKNPEFVEQHGTNPENFFIIVTHEFTV